MGNAPKSGLNLKPQIRAMVWFWFPAKAGPTFDCALVEVLRQLRQVQNIRIKPSRCRMIPFAQKLRSHRVFAVKSGTLVGRVFMPVRVSSGDAVVWFFMLVSVPCLSDSGALKNLAINNERGFFKRLTRVSAWAYFTVLRCYGVTEQLASALQLIVPVPGATAVAVKPVPSTKSPA